MDKDNSNDIPTRIFRRKSAQEVQEDKGHSRGGFRILSEKEIFGQSGTEFIGMAPQISIHDSSRQEDMTGDSKTSTSGWITVYGLTQVVDQEEITKYFMKYGEIVCVENSPWSYMSLEFASKKSADLAISKNQKAILFGKCATFVKPGRFKLENKAQKDPLSKSSDIVPDRDILLPHEGEVEKWTEQIKKFTESFNKSTLVFVAFLFVFIYLMKISKWLH